MPLIFNLKVIPNSGRQQWSLDKSGNLKCYLKKPAEKNLANKELIKMLSKRLKTNEIYIIKGSSSRKKVIEINLDIDMKQLLNILGLDFQCNIQ